ncbi:uncharacterized protein CBL_08456 [Carabus blaptoides fortunei]
MANTTIKNWAREAVAALIEVYRNKACLYDVKSEEYHNRERTRDALAEMVKVVSQYYPSVTEEDCKKKYQSLRNQFCKEYAKVLATKSKSGSGTMDLYTPKLWCYDHLVFLKESVYQKKGIFIGSSQGNMKLKGCDYFPDDEEEEDMTVEYLEGCEEDLETFLPAKIINTPKTTTVQKRKLEQAVYEASSKRTSSESGTKCSSALTGSSRGTTPEAESLSSTLQTHLNKKVENRSGKVSENKCTAFGDFVGGWLNDKKK